MAKRKVDVCDNVRDLEHKKFRINEDDRNEVSVATCDSEGNSLLQEVSDNTKKLEWDCITTDYSDSVTEIFKYYLGSPAVLQQTTTVIYETSEKCKIVSVKKVSNV